jgi:secreted trypsin-like serine protease
MKRLCKLIAHSLLLLGLLSAPHGQASAGDTEMIGGEDSEMIVGGKVAPEGKFPWQARLYTSMDDDKGRCGGTIVADQWVLTAAHCAVVDPTAAANIVPLDTIVVGYGSVDRTKTTKIESEKIVVHPLYLQQGQAGNADIALIKLKQPIANVTAVQLADPQLNQELLTPGAKVIVTGWGAVWDPEDKSIMDMLSQLTSDADLGERLSYPLKLHQVEIQAMDNESCRSMLQPSNMSVADSDICAMSPGSRKNACYGDSGGPLLASAGSRKFVQVGVVSRGCGNTLLPNIYTRVSSFSDWIRDTMAAN